MRILCRMYGALGIITILFIAFLLSRDRNAINIRTVLGALALQILLGCIVLKWETV
ncbi:Na+ dependent nucleoside transporter N-terminal domain-containing protein [Oceanobacillus sp. AG]|uniref:Na+ dependent nucleoside transporter N-terminal domain-containing protein n=1 Tax=Oceanobacillus sp. AG TaxID=2681969 RepID=UPI0012EB93CD|nr:Na+ dependent nucleoside transporter N-terminal domain-containing protein [Oceanobacillus sp. AG]